MLIGDQALRDGAKAAGGALAHQLLHHVGIGQMPCGDPAGDTDCIVRVVGRGTLQRCGGGLGVGLRLPRQKRGNCWRAAGWTLDPALLIWMDLGMAALQF